MNPSRRLLSIGLVGLVAACVHSEVSPVNGSKLTPRPSGCAIQEFPSSAPDYPVEDIATVRATCHVVAGRSACLERLRDDACEAGGDTLYGYKDGQSIENMIVIATVGRRTGNSAKTTAASVAAAASSDGCDPPCSPGYRCQSGTCAAVCNPTCGTGTHCALDRTCQAD